MRDARGEGTREGNAGRCLESTASPPSRIHKPENANHDRAGISEKPEIREGCHRRPKQMFHCSSVRHLITLAGTKREQDGSGAGATVATAEQEERRNQKCRRGRRRTDPGPAERVAGDARKAGRSRMHRKHEFKVNL